MSIRINGTPKAIENNNSQSHQTPRQKYSTQSLTHSTQKTTAVKNKIPSSDLTTPMRGNKREAPSAQTESNKFHKMGKKATPFNTNKQQEVFKKKFPTTPYKVSHKPKLDSAFIKAKQEVEELNDLFQSIDKVKNYNDFTKIIKKINLSNEAKDNRFKDIAQKNLLATINQMDPPIDSDTKMDILKIVINEYPESTKKSIDYFIDKADHPLNKIEDINLLLSKIKLNKEKNEIFDCNNIKNKLFEKTVLIYLINEPDLSSTESLFNDIPVIDEIHNDKLNKEIFMDSYMTIISYFSTAIKFSLPQEKTAKKIDDLLKHINTTLHTSFDQLEKDSQYAIFNCMHEILKDLISCKKEDALMKQLLNSLTELDPGLYWSAKEASNLTNLCKNTLKSQFPKLTDQINDLMLACNGIIEEPTT